jgi:hypothetical protein
MLKLRELGGLLAIHGGPPCFRPWKLPAAFFECAFFVLLSTDLNL